MEIKTRKTEWKLNQEKQKRNWNNKYVVETTSYLSFPIHVFSQFTSCDSSAILYQLKTQRIGAQHYVE